VSLDSTQGQSNQTLLATLPESSENPEQQTLAHEREVALRTGLQKVGQAYRQTLILRDIEGFTYEEIATPLGINVGTVKSRLARGRQELRRKLEGAL
jgi:RNA polymerase sigma-70 factor (ECF subfamily)